MNPETLEQWADAAASVGGEAWAIAVAGSRAEGMADAITAGMIGVVLAALVGVFVPTLRRAWSAPPHEDGLEMASMALFMAALVAAGMTVMHARPAAICLTAPEWCALKAILAAIGGGS